MRIPFVLTAAAVSFSLLSGLNSCQSADEKPVTRDEGKQFAAELEKTVEQRNAKKFNEVLDRDEFIKRARLGKKAESEYARPAIDNILKLGDHMFNTISSKATYRLVKQYEDSGRQHLIFRLYDDGNINYYDIELIHRGKQVKMADLFVFATGENYSSTLHHFFYPVQDELDNITGEESWYGNIMIMRIKNQQKNFEKAEDLYQELPERVQNLRWIQLVHLENCAGLADSSFADAVTHFKSLFPNETKLDLIYLDGWLQHQEYDKALAAVDQLDKSINSDPLLDYYRYLYNNLKNDDEKAIGYLKRLTKNMPDFEDGMILLITYDLTHDKKDEAKPVIATYRKRGSFNQKRLSNLLEAYSFTE